MVEGSDTKALVARGEGVGRVNIAVAGEVERSGVGLASDVSGGLAKGYTRVARGELVGGVTVAVEGGGGGLVRIAELGSQRGAGRVVAMGGAGKEGQWRWR